MKHRTTDRERTHDRNLFYLAEKIGEKRSTTPEGFLVCHDVPIARTGTQLYGASELPLDPGPDGLIRVDRLPEEVFREETLRSFEGKPVTVEHPNEFVTPENWKALAVGYVQNVRRGEGIQDDLIVADLVITDVAAIEYVNKALPEVSAGYEAHYEQTEPGRGVQRDIVGNHVALVERGRAGPRCSIQDHEGKTEVTKAAKPAGKRGFFDRLRSFLDSEEQKASEEEKKTEDSDEEEEEEEKKAEAKDDAGLEARLARLEAILAKLKPMEEAEHGTSLDNELEKEEEEKKTDDNVADLTEAKTAPIEPDATGTVLMGDSLKTLVARAEILAPGIAFKTTDAKKAERAEADAHMRETLTKAYSTADGKAAIEPFLAGREIPTLTGDSLASVFIGAAELMRVKNNQRLSAGSALKRTADFGKALTPADINAANRKFWADHGHAR